MKTSKRQLVQYVQNFLLIGLLGLTEELIRRELMVSHAMLAALIAIGIVLVVGINLLLNISNKIEDLVRPVRTTLLDAKEAYEKATLAAQNAKKEIVAVQNWAFADYQPIKAAEPSRKGYFSTILDVVLKHRIRYKRILQVPATGTLATTNQELLAHLVRCAEQMKPTHYMVQVRRCEPLYIVNFLLIDGETLFVQLDNRDEKTGRYEFSKCILIEDGRGDVVSVFQGMFEELEARSTVIEADELARLAYPLSVGATEV